MLSAQAKFNGNIEGACGIGGLLATTQRSTSTSSYYFCYDGNGNVTALDNPQSTISAQYEYGPFGAPIRVSGPAGKTNPFRWSTKYTDEETDLVSYGYRYYNPSLGRWLNRDPQGVAGGMNLYGFGLNHPISAVDPLGLGLFSSDFDQDTWNHLNQQYGWACDPEKFKECKCCVPKPQYEKYMGDGSPADFNPPATAGGLVDNQFVNSETGQLVSGGGVVKIMAVESAVQLAVQVTGTKVIGFARGTVGTALEGTTVGNWISGTVERKAVGSALGTAESKVTITTTTKVVPFTPTQVTVPVSAATKNISANTGPLRNVVQFEGMEVRAVRDLSHVNQGTLEAMQQYGFAGTTRSGDTIVPHHLGQNPAGPLVEMPGANHSIWNAVQHPLGNAPGVGLTEAERAAYNAWRTEYWKWRATQELNARRVLGGN